MKTKQQTYGHNTKRKNEKEKWTPNKGLIHKKGLTMDCNTSV